MESVLLLLIFPMALVSSWVYRRHLPVIEFLQAEHRMLKKRIANITIWPDEA